MNLRSLYTIVGAAWGAVVGVPVAILLTGYLFGFAWLYLFGDDPWPAQSWLVLLPGPILGIAIFLSLAGIGHRYGARAESELERDRRADAPAGGTTRGERALRRRAVALLGLAALVGLAEVGAVYAVERGQHRERELAAERKANLERLVERRHGIATVEIREAPPWAGGGLEAAVELAGTRAGDYRLAWELTETLHDTPLLVGEQRLALAPHDTTIAVPIDLDAVRERYRAEVLDGRGGVLVDSEWPFRARLRPLLSAPVLDSLPPSARQNLRLGESPLISEGEALVPVRFRID